MECRLRNAATFLCWLWTAQENLHSVRFELLAISIPDEDTFQTTSRIASQLGFCLVRAARIARSWLGSPTITNQLPDLVGPMSHGRFRWWFPMQDSIRRVKGDLFAILFYCTDLAHDARKNLGITTTQLKTKKQPTKPLPKYGCHLQFLDEIHIT